MQKRVKMLSLGQWPQSKIKHKNLQLTPITKRILSQVHLKPQQLLPISFQNFLHLSNPSAQNKANEDDYKDQLQRRRKQVKILREIRSNYILGRDYGPFKQKIPIQLQKEITKSRVLSKCSATYLRSFESNHSNHLTELSRVKSAKANELGICSRVKSRERTCRKQNTQHEYPSYFDKHSKKNANSSRQKHHKLHSNIKKSQPTNEACKSKSNSMIHPEYGCLQKPKNANSYQRKQHPQNRNEETESSKMLCQELLKAIQKWEKLDQKHTAEMEKAQGSTLKEKERLAKIHSMEKVQVRKHMKQIKKRLNSQTKSVQCGDSLFF